jgi:DNA-binding response OmpR family regulator
MPKMNGFELYREIKKIDEEIDVCFFTAFDMANQEFGQLFPNIEAQDFLKKPMPISELALRIHRMLSRSKEDQAPTISDSQRERHGTGS